MRRDQLLKDHLRERFVITLKTGETFDGLLDKWDERQVEFLDPHLVTEKALVPVDGSLLVDRANIAYWQQPTPRVTVAGGQ